MHEHDVSHRYVPCRCDRSTYLPLARDCARTNILMDADSLYPHGFHPRHQNNLPDFHTTAWPYWRSSAPKPVKYHLADFGLSVRFPPGAPRLSVGHIGADREVPELSDMVPYDPFKVDIFILGNVFRRHIHDVRYIPLVLLVANDRLRGTSAWTSSGPSSCR